jgi:uncharacterized protein involved in exopolysaccharide biosynthesis
LDTLTNNQSIINKKDDEFSLRELIIKLLEWWKYLLSKWLIILIFFILGGAFGLLYSYSQKPIYKAQLSFALEDDKPIGGVGSAAGLASQFGIDLGGSGGGAFSGDNLLELMKSRAIVEKTLLTSVDIKGKEQTLAELYISFNKIRQFWQKNSQLKNIQFIPNADRSKFTLQQDSLLGKFYNAIISANLTVNKTDKKLSIIDITVNSENELFSKFFAEKLAKTVSDFYIITKTKKSVQNVDILQHQTDSVRHELNIAITGVASSKDAEPNPNPTRLILGVPSQHRQVDATADQAILTELVKNLEFSKVSLRKETPLIQVIDTPILPLEKTKAGKLKGLIWGGMTSGFLIIAILIMSKVFKNIMSHNE